MHRKIFSYMLTALMLISILSPAALAESPALNKLAEFEYANNNRNWLHGRIFERSLIRTDESDYYSFSYDPAEFTGMGIIGGAEVDLDNDGFVESLMIESQGYEFTATVTDEVDGSIQQTASVTLYGSEIPGNIQANDVFLKQNGDSWYLCCENWYQNNACADGAAWSFSAYCYENNALLPVAELYTDGTDIYGTLDDWLLDASIAEYRSDLPQIARSIAAFNFDIEGLYWGNMICEQDPSVVFVSRTMAIQTIPYEDIMEFSGSAASGTALPGFTAFIIDGSAYNAVLLPDFYLSNNQAPYSADETDATTSATVSSEYIIPDSDIRELTKEELSAYDKDTLALIRNEILARYGYPFKKQIYIDYFESQSWYVRNENFTYDMLTSLEMDNIELIKKLEAK